MGKKVYKWKWEMANEKEGENYKGEVTETKAGQSFKERTVDNIKYHYLNQFNGGIDHAQGLEN